MLSIKKLISALALSAALSAPALALEYPIGVPQQTAGMESPPSICSRSKWNRTA